MCNFEACHNLQAIWKRSLFPLPVMKEEIFLPDFISPLLDLFKPDSRYNDLHMI